MSDSVKILGLDYLDVVSSETVLISGMETTLTITAKDGDGDTDTAYDGYAVTIDVQDEDGNSLPASHYSYALTNGVATIEGFSLTIPDGYDGTLDFYVQTADTENTIKGVSDRDYSPRGWQQYDAGQLTLVITAEPLTVIRDADFTMTVEAQDGHGNKLTAAAPSLTLVLTCDDENDELNTLAATMTAGEWSDTGLQITGGSDLDSATISVYADGYSSDTTGPFTVLDGATETLYIIEHDDSVQSNIDWPDSHDKYDASSLSFISGSPSLYDSGISYNSYYGRYNVSRNGFKCTPSVPYTTAILKFSRSGSTTTPAQVEIRGSTTEPTTGADLKGGTLIGAYTVTNPVFQPSEYVDISALLNGTDPFYVWGIATADRLNIGYPPTIGFGRTYLNLEEILFG